MTRVGEGGAKLWLNHSFFWTEFSDIPTSNPERLQVHVLSVVKLNCIVITT